MDKWQAQYNFWNGFGVPAYEANTVPDAKGLTYPYITYSAVGGGFEEPIVTSASIWDMSATWARADALSDLIEHTIRTMGCPKIDGGRMRVTIGETTFAQSMGDPDNDKIRRKLLTVTFEFMKEV